MKNVKFHKMSGFVSDFVSSLCLSKWKKWEETDKNLPEIEEYPLFLHKICFAHSENKK